MLLLGLTLRGSRLRNHNDAVVSVRASLEGVLNEHAGRYVGLYTVDCLLETTGALTRALCCPEHLLILEESRVLLCYGVHL